jgi:hypothetical protein
MTQAQEQRGGIAAWLLWMLLAAAAVVALAAFGAWHGVDALDSSGAVRIVVDGHNVLADFPWREWNDTERAGFSLMLGIVFLMLLVIVPIAVLSVLTMSLAVGAVALVFALAPFVLPVLLVVWLVRRATATPPSSRPQ